ncbi:hypothetical protein [Streptomyces sp. NPDC058272]|uniref:hypothetical protein n=1 Tax=Streptomyces sp. NPDC058272 TaxID=3346415 RepID=UPI0036E908BD
MCTHPDHEVVTLPDGQVDETHVFTDADMARLVDAVDRMAGRMWQSIYGYPQSIYGYPQEVS